LALEAIRRVWILGERHNFGFFSKLTDYPTSMCGVIISQHLKPCP